MQEIEAAKLLLRVFSPAERRKLGGLALLLMVVGFLEMIGISTVFLFIKILNDLSAGSELTVGIAWIDEYMQTTTPVTFAILGSAAMISVFAIKALSVYGIFYLLTRFIYRMLYQYATRVFAGYVSMPISYHITHNSAEIERNTIQLPMQAFNGAANSVLYLCTNIVSITLIGLTLIVVEPIPSLLAMTLLGLMGGFLIMRSRRRMMKHGQARHTHYAGAIKWVTQAMAGINELRISGGEGYFRDRFSENIRAITQADRRLRMASLAPALINELTLIVGIALILLIFLSGGRTLTEILPVLAMYAVAGVRVLGMINGINTHAHQLQFQTPAIRAFHTLLQEFDQAAQPNESLDAARPDLTFDRRIAADSISYLYENAENAALSPTSLSIGKGMSVAIVGRSGAGKSTLLALLTGLLEPMSGRVLADERSIQENLRSWYRRIAYVPQTIFILDDSIAANVRFGSDQPIDDGEIWRVLDVVQLADRVRASPLGLNTVVGERGSMLSGGERQRLGIARALYRNPELLVLDEATAAMDETTANAVLQSIHKQYPDATIIAVTHRVASAKSADMIYCMQHGQVVDAGTFDALGNRSAAFRELLADPD